jgi:hypothetical protein
MWIVFAPAGILGAAYLFVLVRDEFMPSQYHEKWRLLNALRFVSWYWWIIATLIILTLLTLEGAFRHHQRAIALRGTTSPATSSRERLQQRKSTLEMEELSVRKQLAQEQLRQIQTAKSTLTLNTDAPRQAQPNPSPFIAVDYQSEGTTFVGSNEEEYEDWSEWITFRNTSAEILRKIAIDRFTILGNEKRLGPIPTLIPGDPLVRLRISYIRRALETANIKLKAFNKMPVGVLLTVRYYGARDEPQYVAQYALTWQRSEVSIVPVIGDVAEWLDASNDVPKSDKE